MSGNLYKNLVIYHLYQERSIELAIGFFLCNEKNVITYMFSVLNTMYFLYMHFFCGIEVIKTRSFTKQHTVIEEMHAFFTYLI